MKSKLSEFSYGFAVTYELVAWNGSILSAAPVFPSLYQEGSLGYDVEIQRNGVPLFIQFKLSDYMKRLTLLMDEYLITTFSKPFYRMHIWSAKTSKQHELLCDLQDSGEEVFYAAPFFYALEHLNQKFLNGQVCTDSVFVKPLAIGRFGDDDEHHISFRNTNSGYRFSTPVHLPDAIDFSSMTEQVERRLRQQQDGTNWAELSERIAKLLLTQRQNRHLTAQIEHLMSDKHPLNRIALMSQLFLNCQFFIVSTKEAA